MIRVLSEIQRQHFEAIFVFQNHYFEGYFYDGNLKQLRLNPNTNRTAQNTKEVAIFSA